MCCGFMFEPPEASWQELYAKPGGLLGGLRVLSPQALLAVRVAFLIIWMLCVVWSLYDWHEQGRGFGFWWIKLTHWGAVLQLVYFGLSALTTHQALSGPVPDGKRGETSPWFASATWFLGSAVWAMSLVIVVLYWAIEFKPGPGKPTAIQVVTHGVNFVLALADNSISSLPYRWNQIYAPALLSLAYVAFTKAYYVAGGTDWSGAPYIYEVLDWSDPAKTMKFVAGIFFVVLPLFYGLFLLSVAIRDWLFKQAGGPQPDERSEHQPLQVA